MVLEVQLSWEVSGINLTPTHDFNYQNLLEQFRKLKKLAD